MFKTKKDIDRHVRTNLAKLNDKEKKYRGFTISKLYYKINEFLTAQNYVSDYLSVNEESAPAHKLLGQCYLQLKKPDKALSSFQRSLQLDAKQPDMLIEVCKLILANNSINNNAEYWCALAESEKVQDDSIFNLRLKILNKDNVGSKQMEDRILSEISNRPNDSKLRARLVHYQIEQNKIVEAFRYAFNVEMSYNDFVSTSPEWYNIVWLMLSKYKQVTYVKKDWDFWLLQIICLERQLNISFNGNNSLANNGINESSNLLFTLDQHLNEAAQVVSSLCPEKELALEFLRHFRGQFCLHAAALIFKKELIQNSNWRETTKIALPLLMLAYQSGAPNLQEPWIKHIGEQSKHLMQLWNREAAFRCAQAGRTLLSCINNITNNDSTILNQVNQIVGAGTVDRSPWTSADDLLNEIRQYCSDTSWRNKIFRQLFTNSDQTTKIASSLFINSQQLANPIYDLPIHSQVEHYEEVAQYLKPISLQHITYLCLGIENLSDIRCKYFSGLNFSTQVLSFCGAESLNQLDIETFLYATAIQAKRILQLDRACFENYRSKICGRPRILPFVNIQSSLCTEEQKNWWIAAYQVYKNLTGDNLAEVRANLQYGIEAVRGVNGPKIDLIIILKLGKIFVQRAQDVLKPVEKNAIELRAESLYKYGIHMLKIHNKGVLEPFRRIFKYVGNNNSAIEREINALAEDAVQYLAERFFKRGEFEECIEELSGLQLPFATYYQSEAYCKLDESNKTPKKTKKLYLDKARDCLTQTLNLLESSNIETNHPLNSVIHSEINRLQYPNQHSKDQSYSRLKSGDNTDQYEEVYLNETSPVVLQLNKSRRSNTGSNDAATHTSFQQQQLSNAPISNELETLIKQIATTLSFLKEEVVDFVKPEVQGLRKEIQDLKEKVNKLENNLNKKKSETPSPAVLDDYFVIDDELQNQIYQQTHQRPQQNIATGQPQQRIQTPNIMQQHLANSYNSPMYNPGYAPINYFSQYMMPQAQPSTPSHNATMTHHLNSAAAAWGIANQHVPYENLNYNIPPTQNTLPLGGMDSLEAKSLFNILTQQNNRMLPANSQSLSISIPFAPQTGLSSSSTLQQQQQPQPISTFPQQPQPTTTATPNVWNKTFNNTPVEKGPPVNVVITNSDPLPLSNAASLTTQPPLSVTIPQHHIKPSLVPNEPALPMFSNTGFSMFSSSPITSTGIKTPTLNKTPAKTISFSTTPTLSFGNTITSPLVNTGFGLDRSLNRTSESADENELYKSSETEYDPRPDFKPIIQLPDEIVVKTGEEDEEILFSHRAKLLRFVDKEWKERGIGDIKILKSKNDGSTRILMRREQTHKICANHKINNEMKLTSPSTKKDEKCYIWSANDYADEELKLETLCVRFKHSETAKEFHNVFMKAIDEDRKLKNQAEVDGNKKETVLDFSKKSTLQPVTSTTTIFGGSIFTSNINEGFSATTTNTTTTAVKPSPFANFTFGQNSTSTPSKLEEPGIKPFERIFGSLNKTPMHNLTNTSNSLFSTPTGNINLTTESENKVEHTNRSISETEDDYVPTAEFKPVIPLPNLVEIQTGEENQIVLFEHRAKLLRFDKQSSDWKERGIGIMKILQDQNDSNVIRLVMRRETIHKLCCNQRLAKDTKFNHPKNAKLKNSLMWVGQDFSENELTTETLTVRFKTEETCKKFHDAILKAQANIVEKNDVEDNKQNVASKQETVKGFGDKFKPKAGSWSCNDCYTSNTSETLYCMACESPKDDTVPKKPPKSILGEINSNDKPKFSFGFPAVPAVNSTLETNSVEKSKPIMFATAKPTSDNKSTNIVSSTSSTASIQGFGDKFKPKEGSWSCNDCYTQNTAETLHCIACESPKDDTIPKKEKSGFAPSADAPKFSFGFNNITSTNVVPTTNTSFTFSTASKTTDENNITTPAFTFSTGFGVTNAITSTSSSDQTAKSGAVGSIQKPAFSFTLSNSTSGSGDSNKKDDLGNDLFSLGKKEFNFALKSKSPGKSKSPMKNNISTGAGDEEGSDEECVEEENNTYFTPVIPLPEKVEIKTGEEEEEVLYCHRAKLFRFLEKEWKERGLGDVKILRHVQTQKLRVVMRREQVHKICLNHVLNPEVEYKQKDDKSWSFAVNDFSEGEIEPMQFCIRFKTKEIAEHFMDVINQALSGEAKAIVDTENNTEILSNSVEDPLKVCVNIPPEEQKLANELQLSNDFFAPSTPCPGCRGCNADTFIFPNYENINLVPDEENPLPLHLSSLNLNKDNSTILKQSLFSTSIVTPSKIENVPNESTTTENKNIFGGFSQSKTNVSKGPNDSFNTFSFNLDKNPPTTENNAVNTEISDNKKTGDNNFSGSFVFGNNPAITGGSTTSIFGSPITTDKKSIFGGGTIFGGATTITPQPSIFSTTPIFGATILSNTTNTSPPNTVSDETVISTLATTEPQAKENENIFLQGTNKFGINSFGSIFGGDTSVKPIFGQSTFGQSNAPTNTAPSLFGDLIKSNSTPNTFDELKTKTNADIKLNDANGNDNNLFKNATGSLVDFASLAKTAPANANNSFNNSTENPVGGFYGLTHQDAFSNFGKSKNKSSDGNANDTGGEDSNYDPHYEPAIELPKEIVVSTGEENENKIFGERATLFRYDDSKKEWKERGVGELKILHHPGQGTYRLLLRREQIHKCVLNHAINSDFQMSPLSKSNKAFCWGGMNYAEEPAQVEKLAARFKNSNLATKFENEVNKCLTQIQIRADLDPEKD